jgi:hypothetical protein
MGERSDAALRVVPLHSVSGVRLLCCDAPGRPGRSRADVPLSSSPDSRVWAVNDAVYALAVSDSTVCAGGQFASIGDQTRNKIGAPHARS